MESHCLTREEYKFLLSYMLDGNYRFSEISEKIDRASTTWDINIVGSNCFLSILLEQKIKKGEHINKAFIDGIYDLRNQLYFTIDELDQSAIDYIIRNHMPKNRNYFGLELQKAKNEYNKELTSDFEDKLKNAFEDDLIEILNNYYEKN